MDIIPVVLETLLLELVEMLLVFPLFALLFAVAVLVWLVARFDDNILC